MSFCTCKVTLFAFFILPGHPLFAFLDIRLRSLPFAFFFYVAGFEEYPQINKTKMTLYKHTISITGKM